MTRVLVGRLDSAGDVLLAGPAVRAVAARADEVVFLCGPRGRAAAELLPGIDRLVVFHAPWIDPEPEPVTEDAMLDLVDTVRSMEPDEAIVITSFHQSPLPLALLLRMAGVRTIAAISEDYPGSLLDVRHRIGDETVTHEVERALSLVATLGYSLPPGDDGGLRIRRVAADRPPFVAADRYVVVHPGASVPARAWSPDKNAELVDALRSCGHTVVVTGSHAERELTAFVAGGAREGVVDLGGQLDLPGLAEVLARAGAVVVGNTGPAHLAAAVGTPVVSIFAPTVPAARWRPWGVPVELFGVQDIGCAGCRARECPVGGQPCVGAVRVGEVVEAVERSIARSRAFSPEGAGDVGNQVAVAPPTTELEEVTR